MTSYSTQSDIYELRFIEQCTKSQVNALLPGWAEAGYHVATLNEWGPSKTDKYADAVRLYMGSQASQNPYASTTLGVAANQAKIHRNLRSTDYYTHVYSDENIVPQQYKGCSPYGGAIAYTWADKGNFWTNFHMVAGPGCFNFWSLGQVTQTVEQQGLDASNMWLTWGNQGHLMLHEAFHWDVAVGGDPHIGDAPNWFAPGVGIYGSWNVSYIAGRTNADGTQTTADVYSTAALANFAMDVYGLNSPPMPGSPQGNDAAEVTQDLMPFLDPAPPVNVTENKLGPGDDNSNVDCVLPGDQSASAKPAGGSHDYCLMSTSQLTGFDPSPYSPLAVAPPSVADS